MGLADLRRLAADPRSVKQRIVDRQAAAKRAKEEARRKKNADVAAKLAARAVAPIKKAEERQAAKADRAEQRKADVREAVRPFVGIEIASPIISHRNDTPLIPNPYSGARQVSIEEINYGPIGGFVKFNRDSVETYVGQGAFMFKLYVVLRNGAVWTPVVKVGDEVEAALSACGRAGPVAAPAAA